MKYQGDDRYELTFLGSDYIIFGAHCRMKMQGPWLKNVGNLQMIPAESETRVGSSHTWAGADAGNGGRNWAPTT